MKEALLQVIKKEVHLPDKEAALALSYFKSRKFKRNDILLQSGSVAKEVFFVVKGLLHQYYIDDAGNERTCDFTFENGFSTDLEGFTRKTPSASTIKALKETNCLVISCPDLMQLIKDSQAVSDFFNVVVENIASESMRRTKSLLTNSPEKRFAELLDQQPDIFQKIPQRYIAQYLGIAPESLSRIKKRMMVPTKS